MCFWRHQRYACTHPAPDKFASPCEKYPTCNVKRFQQGIFNLRTRCPACIYD
ncbi:uncharacterized protein C8A04DRAFT_13229 [Dichotomopilus funicola]|uniref:Uncharacterized protein n=1 Tax=Dichotomopilus funicola TaxID=1934379 RepID=A0AAN6ZL34_9PEZI|nr:hypothetical protein C8A04DRAFT_13229 [Dichotomopilus funicola]